MPAPKLLPSLQTAPKSPGKFKPDQNAKDRPDLFSVPMDVIYGLLGMDANSTGRMQNGQPAQLSSPNAIGQTLSAGLPIAGASRLLYSRLEKAAKALPEFAHPNRIFSLLKSNASGEEMSLRGMMDFLKSQGDRKIAKSAVLEHLGNNPLPQMAKTTLTSKGVKNPEGTLYTNPEGSLRTAYDREGLSTPLGASRVNSKENLYHLRDTRYPIEYDAPHFKDTQLDLQTEDGITHSAAEDLLMHSRTNERHLPGRGRTLMGEEDQSDLHQNAVKYGYIDPSIAPQREAIHKRINEIYDEQDQLMRQAGGAGAFLEDIDGKLPEAWHKLRAEQDELIKQFNALKRPGVNAVPDAPYKQEWSNILWKDQLAEAVENPNIKGYSWTTGDIQNKRYGIGEIDELTGKPYGDPEGKRRFYDQRKKESIDKFVRQHGSKVEQITAPGKSKYLNYEMDPETGVISGNLDDLDSDPEELASIYPRATGDIVQDESRFDELLNMLSAQEDRNTPGIKLWYVSLPDHVKESIKRGGIPFLMALWATHQAGQDSNMAIPTPPGVNQ